jgi:hypothetical protein
VFGDGETALGDEASVVLAGRRQEQLVQLDHRGDPGHRHQVTAAESSYFSFHAALLVGTGRARSAEEAVEAVVGAQGDEPIGLSAVATAQHSLHRRFQVVVANPLGDTAQVLEGSRVAVQEDLLAFVQIGPGIGPPRRRQPQDEQLHLGQQPGHIDTDRPEVDLGLLAQGMVLGDEHLDQGEVLATADLGDIAPHGGLAHHRAVLLHQPLPDPPGGVALLSGRALILLQPLLDERLPPVHHRRRLGGRLLPRRRER